MNIKTCRHCDMSFNRDDEAPIPHDRCERCHEKFKFFVGPSTSAPQYDPADVAFRSKYHREIKPGVWVDVYDVIHAFGVTNGALQHLIKKALAAGERGHKTREQDLADIVASAKRAKELEQ